LIFWRHRNQYGIVFSYLKNSSSEWTKGLAISSKDAIILSDKDL